MEYPLLYTIIFILLYYFLLDLQGVILFYYMFLIF